MPELWDPQPFPSRGDDDERLTFEGVGRVMTTWEHVEFGLARLLSIFAKAPDTPEGLAGYKGTIFRERLNSLRREAHSYFVAHCNQELEGGFDRLCYVFEAFADRRNEVAHGAVFDMTQFDDPGTKAPPNYMLIPPYHSVTKYGAGRPLYGYTSVELAELNTRLRAALAGLHSYRHLLMGTLREWLQGRA